LLFLLSDKRLLVKRASLPSEKIGLEQSFVYDQFGNVITSNKKDLWTLETRSQNYVYDLNGINVDLKFLVFFLNN
jgi:hypothetical protein